MCETVCDMCAIAKAMSARSLDSTGNDVYVPRVLTEHREGGAEPVSSCVCMCVCVGTH